MREGEKARGKKYDGRRLNSVTLNRKSLSRRISVLEVSNSIWDKSFIRIVLCHVFFQPNQRLANWPCY